MSGGIFYKIKHLNSVSAMLLFFQGYSSTFLCCRVSLGGFCQAAIHGCGITTRSKCRPGAGISLKMFIYVVCQKYHDL